MNMDIFIYIDKMKIIQSTLLEYIECDCYNEENFQNLIQILKDYKVTTIRHELKLILHLLLKISNNHYRPDDFFNKIEKILLFLQNEIQKNFSNTEIFDIFKSNKRILLFLIEQKIVTVNKSICETLIKDKYKRENYLFYFYPEIKDFLDSNIVEEMKFDLPSNFEEKRKLGENEEYVWQLIQNDFIDEFKRYSKLTNLPLTSTIKPSIFETNSFLIDKTPTLIDISAFFGSIHIFKHLFSSGVDLSPSLWIFAIHGQSHEIINLLEENEIMPENDSYSACFEESVKCHHNYIASYLLTKYLNNNSDEKFDDSFRKSLKFYNFSFILNRSIKQSAFYELCRYGYFHLVDILMNLKVFDINQLYQVISMENNIFYRISKSFVFFMLEFYDFFISMSFFKKNNFFFIKQHCIQPLKKVMLKLQIFYYQIRQSM